MTSARCLLLFCLLALASSARAAEWTEYRRVVVEAGRPARVTLDDTAAVTGGEAGLVRSVAGPTVEILAPGPGSWTVELVRETLGPIVILVETRADRTRPEAPAPDPAVPLSPVSAPSPAPRVPAAPPIVLPAAPLVLRPAATAASPSPASAAPAAATPAEAPAEVRPRAAARIETAPAATEAPRNVTAREVPRGETRRVDTSPLAGTAVKPGELALYELANDLLARGLFTDAIRQFDRLMTEYPRTNLREAVQVRIGQAYRNRAEVLEEESFRQRDLRRSGTANEALDAAISDYGSAVRTYRDVVAYSKNPDVVRSSQLEVARSLHGLVRSQFEKGGLPQDSPAVVVEYLRSFVGDYDTTNAASARLGIARYYRDLGDARMAARLEAREVRAAYDRAVREYRSLVDSSPQSGAAEESLIDLARLHDRNLEMRKFTEAVMFYEMLLARFPESRYAEEARSRARWIRDNYL